MMVLCLHAAQLCVAELPSTHPACAVSSLIRHLGQSVRLRGLMINGLIMAHLHSSLLSEGTVSG